MTTQAACSIKFESHEPGFSYSNKELTTPEGQQALGFDPKAESVESFVQQHGMWNEYEREVEKQLEALAAHQFNNDKQTPAAKNPSLTADIKKEINTIADTMASLPSQTTSREALSDLVAEQIKCLKGEKLPTQKNDIFSR